MHMHLAKFDREDAQEFVKRNRVEYLQDARIKNSSDKLSGYIDIDGDFGRLNCDGRTLARGSFTVKHSNETEAQDKQQLNRRARARITGPTTRTVAGLCRCK
jgi:hypothetical protein